jgi:hypothetical protein
MNQQTDIQQQVNRLLSLNGQTIELMLDVRQDAVNRARAGLNRELRSYNALCCARLLREFDLKMGDHVQLPDGRQFVLADIDENGRPVGIRIKSDGTLDLTDREPFFRQRLLTA